MALTLPPPPPPPGSSIRRRTGWPCRLAAAGLLMATPVATWRLAGPNPGNEIGSDPTLRPDDYDYLFHPPEIDPTLERVVGIVAFIVLFSALITLVFAHRTGRLDRRWWAPILALALAGAIVGAGERVTTAAVVGANIGGGMVLLFGVPIVLVLILGSAIRMGHLLRTTRIAEDRS